MKRASPFAVFVALCLALACLCMSASAGPFAISGGGSSGTACTATDTQVLFWDSTACAGDAGMTYNKTTDTLTLGTLNTVSGTLQFTFDARSITVGNNAWVINNAAGTHIATAATSGAGWVVGSNGMHGWSGSSDALNAAIDTGLGRTAQKVVEVNSGTLGAYTGTALVLGPQTVAQLPTCSSTTKGARATVTDADSTTFLAALVGSSSNIVPAFCDGVAWKIG